MHYSTIEKELIQFMPGSKVRVTFESTAVKENVEVG